jgi:putative addiction module antidote
MNALTIKKFGNSAGVILPKELLAQLGTDVGGTLSVTRTSRGIELSVSDDEFARQMAIAREIMIERRDALRELAK